MSSHAETGRLPSPPESVPYGHVGTVGPDPMQTDVCRTVGQDDHESGCAVDSEHEHLKSLSRNSDKGRAIRTSRWPDAIGLVVIAGMALILGALLRDVRQAPMLAAVDLPIETHASSMSAGPEVTIVDEEPVEATDEVRYFDGRPLRPVKTLVMVTTAYSPDARSCGNFADGITASGYSVWTNGMKLAAADTSILPFGTLISVPGYDGGNVVPVLDRGGAIKGHRLDMLYPTHEQARQWGVQKLRVTVWEYAD